MERKTEKCTIRKVLQKCNPSLVPRLHSAAFFIHHVKTTFRTASDQSWGRGLGTRLENLYMIIILRGPYTKFTPKQKAEVSNRAWHNCNYPCMLSRMGVVIKNPWSAIFISAKCSAQPIRENLSLHNLTLYSK